MTAAELLREMYSLGARIEAKQEKLEALNLLALSNGGIRYDKDRVVTSLPQEGGFENKVIDAAMLCKEIQADIDRLTAEYEKGRQIIASVKNPTDRAILEMLYVHHIKIKDIAERLHYTEANIYYRKKKALKRLNYVIL